MTHANAENQSSGWLQRVDERARELPKGARDDFRHVAYQGAANVILAFLGSSTPDPKESYEAEGTVELLRYARAVRQADEQSAAMPLQHRLEVAPDFAKRGDPPKIFWIGQLSAAMVKPLPATYAGRLRLPEAWLYTRSQDATDSALPTEFRLPIAPTPQQRAANRTAEDLAGFGHDVAFIGRALGLPLPVAELPEDGSVALVAVS